MIQPRLKKNYISLILFWIILLVSITNRFYGLDRLSLWADELWVVMASVRGSLMDMFSFVYYHDNHPPGHYLLMRYWQIIFGDSDYAIRFPFAVSGVFLVYSTYRIAKEHYSVEAALIAATLVSGSWQAIYYSQEARANIMVAVAVLWALHYFCKLTFADERMDKKNLAGFWISATFACYLHYSGLVFVSCLGIIYGSVLLIRRQTSDFLLGLKLFVPVIILYIPWLPAFIYQLTHKPAGAWWSVPEWMDLYGTFKVLFEFGSQLLWLYQIVFIALCVTVGCFCVDRKRICQVVANRCELTEAEVAKALQFSFVVLLMAVMPVLVFFIKSRISQPVYDSRHFIYVIPLMAMVAGYFISLCLFRAATPLRQVILALIILALMVSQSYCNVMTHLYTGQHLKPEYREAVQVLAQDTKNPTADIFIVGNSEFFNHYLQRSLAGRTTDYLFVDVQQMPELNGLITTRKPAALYFLETPETGGYEMISSLDKTLAEFYRPVCRTAFHFAQVIKFDAQLVPSTPLNWNQLPVCNPASPLP